MTKLPDTTIRLDRQRCLFPLGQGLATPGALKLLQREELAPAALLARHVSGDWGNIHPEDVGLNEEALVNGDRIMSVYHLPKTGEILWIITEADRCSTTLLLPEEY